MLRKCGAFRRERVDSDLQAAVAFLADALNVVEARLRLAARAPDRLAELEGTIATIVSLLLVRGDGGRPSLLSQLEQLETRVEALEKGKDDAGRDRK